MSKGKKNRGKNRTGPYHGLGKVKSLIQQGKVYLDSAALDGADDCFGWKEEDILRAISKLQPKHCYKSEPHRFDPSLVVDYYRAYVMGENVFTHFHIENDILMVYSLKEI